MSFVFGQELKQLVFDEKEGNISCIMDVMERPDEVVCGGEREKWRRFYAGLEFLSSGEKKLKDINSMVQSLDNKYQAKTLTSQALARRGFTLIELMIVSSIIGILVAIAIPKFSDLIIRSREATVHGKLGSLRSAIMIYYSDNEGMFPDTVFDQFRRVAVGGKYMTETPLISIPTVRDLTHQDSGCTGSTANWDFGTNASCAKQAFTYFNNSGVIFIDCTHLDTKGSIWSSY